MHAPPHNMSTLRRSNRKQSSALTSLKPQIISFESLASMASPSPAHSNPPQRPPSAFRRINTRAASSPKNPPQLGIVPVPIIPALPPSDSFAKRSRAAKNKQKSKQNPDLLLTVNQNKQQLEELVEDFSLLTSATKSECLSSLVDSKPQAPDKVPGNSLSNSPENARESVTDNPGNTPETIGVRRNTRNRNVSTNTNMKTTIDAQKVLVIPRTTRNKKSNASTNARAKTVARRANQTKARASKKNTMPKDVDNGNDDDDAGGTDDSKQSSTDQEWNASLASSGSSQPESESESDSESESAHESIHHSDSDSHSQSNINLPPAKSRKVYQDPLSKWDNYQQKRKDKQRIAASTPLQHDHDTIAPTKTSNRKTGGTKPTSRKKTAKAKKKGFRAASESFALQSDHDLDDDIFKDSEYLVKRVITQKADPPQGLKANLLPFQRESLYWMCAQEETSHKGGILADEMGMGKTVQALSLILARKQKQQKQLQEGTRRRQKQKSASASASDPQPTQDYSLPSQGQTAKTTLVICPLIAVYQWRAEIERHTDQGALSVYVYHGPKRAQDVDELAKYDVIISTYSIVESEFRKRVGLTKEECRYCNRKFYPDKMAVHLKYFCGPNAERSEKQKKTQKSKARLDVKKKAERDRKLASRKSKRKRQSEDESDQSDADSDIDADLGPPQMTFYKYMDEIAIARKNLKGEFEQKARENAHRSPLHNIKFHRIILDESHFIKARSCNTAKAIFALEADYRWALSGTPLQNRVGELFSCIRFLRLDPYAFYYTNDGQCQILNWEFGPGHKCDQCGRHRMAHYLWWNKHIMNPISKYGYRGQGATALKRLKTEILDQILLRRTKAERASEIILPPKTVVLRADKFNEYENDFYDALYTKSQSKFNEYVQTGTVLHNYAHIFDLLIRLRQAVDHPYLVAYSERAWINENSISVEGVACCGICNDEPEDCIETACKHLFCRECIRDLITVFSGTGKHRCPVCDKLLSVDLSAPMIERPHDLKMVNCKKPPRILERIPDLSKFRSSTKVEALMEEIKFMKEEDPSSKCIVFSQFVSYLEIIRHRLSLANMPCVLLDGRMSAEARSKCLEAFQNDPNVSVFLISLKAGGVALNLTIASRVFIMDPWWNPAVEFQAMDRIHRLGQQKAVKCVRFVIADTIEDRVLKLQDKKQLVFESTVGQNAEALGKLSEADMRFLFS